MAASRDASARLVSILSSICEQRAAARPVYNSLFIQPCLRNNFSTYQPKRAGFSVSLEEARSPSYESRGPEESALSIRRETGDYQPMQLIATTYPRTSGAAVRKGPPPRANIKQLSSEERARRKASPAPSKLSIHDGKKVKDRTAGHSRKIERLRLGLAEIVTINGKERVRSTGKGLEDGHHEVAAPATRRTQKRAGSSRTRQSSEEFSQRSERTQSSEGRPKEKRLGRADEARARRSRIAGKEVPYRAGTGS